MTNRWLPRVLVVDDLLGRSLPSARNSQRANFCANFMLCDVSEDEQGKGAPQKIKQPIAEAVFCRGQRPVCSKPGDTVENRLDDVLTSIESGWERVKPGALPWSLVLLDLCFYTGEVRDGSDAESLGIPNGRPEDDNPKSYFGLKILAEINTRFSDLPVVILSSKPREEVARDFSYLGALDFLPRGDERSPSRLKEIIELHGLVPDDTDTMVGRSRPLLLTLREARRAARDRRNILIRGETGTGKELLARYIHYRPESLPGKPFVVVNSGGLDSVLYASELFGHVRGAFTDAKSDRKGKILQADGGDLFLDEIGNMPLGVQASLLRALEYREISPVGSSDKARVVDVRYIFATNDDIDALAAAGRYRSDLIYRLREWGTIYLPPLRERQDDFPLLVESFVREAEAKNAGALRRQIDSPAIEVLQRHDWPGNIRELRTCVLRAVNDYPGVEHLAPVHFVVDRPSRSQEPDLSRGQAASDPQAPGIPANTQRAGCNIRDFLAEIDLDSLNIDDLSGSLPVSVQFIVRLLRASLKATAKQPGNELSITRAISLISEPAIRKTGPAADMIKRIMNLYPEAVRSLVTDPVLEEALEASLKNRPPGQKKSNKRQT